MSESRPWTQEELWLVEEMYLKGIPVKEIAETLNRTKKSILSKLRILRARKGEYYIPYRRFNPESMKRNTQTEKNSHSPALELLLSNNHENENKDNTSREKISLEFYRKLLRKLLNKENIKENEFNSMLYAIENYYFVNKDFIGALELLNTVKNSGKF